ncbi:MAG: 50S ribosomal protein L9 [Alphaproteobacteria bacterium]
MEVILLERVEKLGQMGDVVNVKPGFARNYLLPQKKAMRATEQNRTVFEQQRAQLETVNLDRKVEAEAVAEKLDGLKVIVVRQASESDQLYGSVTVRNIAQAVTEAGFTVNSKQVQLARPIKTVGLHDVRVFLHPEVTANVVANVARSEEEADLQARGIRVSAQDDEDEAIEFEAGEAAQEPAPESEADAEAVAADDSNAEAVAEADDSNTEARPESDG